MREIGRLGVTITLVETAPHLPAAGSLAIRKWENHGLDVGTHTLSPLAALDEGAAGERERIAFVQGYEDGFDDAVAGHDRDPGPSLDAHRAANPTSPPAADGDRARIDHLSVAEQIMATLQEEVSAFDAYDEDEISSLEANIAGIIQAALKSTGAKEGKK